MWIFPTEVIIIDRQERTQYTNRPINMNNIVTFDDDVFVNKNTKVEKTEGNHGSEYHIQHEDGPSGISAVEGLPSIQFKLSNGEGFHWVYPTEADRDEDLKRITSEISGKSKKK